CYFPDTATTEIYTLSLHDALPISSTSAATSSALPSRTNVWSVTSRAQRDAARSTWTTVSPLSTRIQRRSKTRRPRIAGCWRYARSEEHTSELQSRGHLVCRLLLEK